MTDVGRRRRGMPSDQLALSADMRAMGYPWPEIAKALCERFGLSALVAMRLAHGWSQRDAAEEWNRRWPDEPKTFKNFSYWENWPSGGYQPRLSVLDRLARLYECRVADLVADLGDYRRPGREVRVGGVDVQSGTAFLRADGLLTEIEQRWPGAVDRLDALRRNPPGRWPQWCLLPTHVVSVATGCVGGPVPAVAGLFAWRYSRSVYVYHPQMATDVLSEPPDDLTGADPLRVLPEWCVYVAGGTGRWMAAGLWGYLDYDYGTGSPLLRLLVDLGTGGLDALVPVNVRLDVPVTEAVALKPGGGLTAETLG